MMTLAKYLANHSPNRSIDKVVIKWYSRNFGSNYQEREKQEWDEIIDAFFGETATKPINKQKFQKNDIPAINADDKKPSAKKGEK